MPLRASCHTRKELARREGHSRVDDATIVRKFAVSPSISFSFDPDFVLPDGSMAVVKRSTDPVRMNNTAVIGPTTSLAAGYYEQPR